MQRMEQDERMQALRDALSSSERRVKELEAALRKYWEAERDSIREHLKIEYDEPDPSEQGIKEFTCQCRSDIGFVCAYCAAREALEAPHEP